MTKKDYILIAEILKLYNASMLAIDYKITGHALLREMTMKFAESLAETNPRFDKGRFLEACGVKR